MKVFLFFSLLSLTISAMAQDIPCNCCTDAHKQFDFWIGEWEVFDSAGTRVGTNRIIPMHDSCVLQENWVGAQVTTGTSYNYYNPTDKTWNQLWLDNQGTILKLKGTFNGVSMILQSEPDQGRNGLYINRISWEPKGDGTVIQTWDAVAANGDLLQNLFKGIYKRVE